jgi:hypothetical protein
MMNSTAQVEADRVVLKGECPICFDILADDGTLCRLPCEHEFHQECEEYLRKHGVHQAVYSVAKPFLLELKDFLKKRQESLSS